MISSIPLLLIVLLPCAVASERPMSTDRPDKTESAYTLSPGRFQFEATIYSYSEDKSDSLDKRQRTQNIADLQIRAAATENGEAQLMMPAFTKEDIKDNQGKTHTSSAGDIVLRYRQNIHGNDRSSHFAWAIMPYTKLPAGKFSNDVVEGGIMFPTAIELDNKWSMGAMLDLSHAYNEEENSWRTDYITTWALSRSFTERLNGFIELYNQVSDDTSQAAVSTFDFGVTWQQTKDLQLDLGSFIGLTDAAVDETFFTGVAMRF